MADELWRSHSFDKTKDSDGGSTTSGSFTYWADDPVAEFEKYTIGSKFRPLEELEGNGRGPELKITKISVSDNVLGLKDGKPFRQWQITVEGDSSDSGDDTKIRYSFDISKDDKGLIYKNGSMEAVNDGDNPVFSFAVGDTMNLPGVGDIVCTKVSGGDEWTDKGIRRWTMTYEGSTVAADANSSTKVRYTLDISKNDNGLIYKTGTMEVVNVGDAPAFTKNLHESFTVPGLGSVECVKVGSGNEWNGDVQVWTNTYDGVVIEVDGDANANVRYSFDISKDDKGNTHKTGSIEISTFGDAPNLLYGIGNTINVPGAGELKCIKSGGSNEWIEGQDQRWTTTYEGEKWEYVNDDRPKYTYSKKKEGGAEVLTGTKEVSRANPDFTLTGFDIGENAFTCTSVSGSSEIMDDGTERWTVTYEATADDDSQEKTTYSLEMHNNDNGLKYYRGSMTVVKFDESDNGPTISPELGGNLSIFGVTLKCTRISKNDDYESNGKRRWTITYEGAAIDETSGDNGVPSGEDEGSESESLNGITTRSVDGVFVVLMRSNTPVTKKTIVKYFSDNTSRAAPGGTYEGGTVISYRKTKQVIKENGQTLHTYWRHEIELES